MPYIDLTDIEFQPRIYQTYMIQQLITTDDKSYDEIRHFKQPSSIYDIVYRRL